MMMQQETAIRETSHDEFDPASYLQYIYSPTIVRFEENGMNEMKWIMACLYRAFTEGDISGDLLIDVGSGPTLYQVLSGCEIFNKVLLTDFLEVNRQELKSWLQGEGNFDWTPFLQHVCKLEGRGLSDWREKEARLRAVVSDVGPIDVHQAQPIAPDVLPSVEADCLVSCFCLESACANFATFTRALGNIGKLLRPGGHLLLLGSLEGTWYSSVPDVTIPMFNVNTVQICASLQDQGYSLIRLEVYTYTDLKPNSDDSNGLFFVKAKKL